MTKDEFRDYVDFLRSQDEISYDVYSGLLDGIDTLEQDAVSFDFELYEAGMMSMSKGMIEVLDKIRAEIQEERKVENIPEDVEMWDYIRALDRTLSIIDKYRESEKKE